MRYAVFICKEKGLLFLNFRSFLTNGDESSTTLLVAQMADWKVILRETEVDKVFNGSIHKVGGHLQVMDRFNLIKMFLL